MFHYGFLNASFSKCLQSAFFVYTFLIIIITIFFYVRVSQYQHLISLLADGGGGAGAPIFLPNLTHGLNHI